MDVVVRTPHGDADVAIVSAPGSTTLGDLLATVTGQAPPAVARVGDRVHGTSQRLDALGLHVGAVIDSRPHDSESADDADGRGVDLLQVTGRGAGSVRTLSPGRYRIGAGRRLNADELDRAPVETEAFEIVVGETGPRHEWADVAVKVSPGERLGARIADGDADAMADVTDDVAAVLAPVLDGSTLAEGTPWVGGPLSVAGRVFRLAPAAHVVRRTGEGADRMTPDPRGTIPFQRAPVGDPGPTLVAATARRRAARPSSGLWSVRGGDEAAYRFAFGIGPDGGQVCLDLATDRIAAIVGTERFVTALARTVLVEAATSHGPSDLRIVVASTPERIGQWDWAKWLPHLRRDGNPLAGSRLLSSSDEIDEWATRSLHAPADVTTTLLVLDSPTLWTHRESPLHALVTAPPDHVRVVALCSSPPEAPGATTAFVDEVAPEAMEVRPMREGASLVGSLARLRTVRDRTTTDVDHVRPALVTTATASEVALDIAAFDDLDIVRPAVAPSTFDAPTISELVDLHTPRSSGTAISVSVALVDDDRSDGIGAPPKPRRPARIDLAAARTTLVSCDDREAHDALVASIILGAAAGHRSDRLAMLTVGSERPAWHDGIPHLAGHVDRASPDDPARLIHRVAHVLTSEPGLDVLVVVEDAFATSRPIHTARGATPVDLAAGILELVDSLSRVHLVLTTDLPTEQIDAAVRDRCAIEIELSGPSEHPQGVLSDGETRLPIVGPTRTRVHVDVEQPGEQPDERGLRLLPRVVGRAMTPLERRVERLSKQAADGDRDEGETRVVAHRIAKETAGASTATGALLPPPLPTSVAAERLLADHQGDGVPIGLLDRPEHAGHEAYWWRPGRHGSMLVVGSPRSGVAGVVDLLTLGIVSRLGADEVRVHAVEPLPQRRRALESLPHTVDTVSTDEPAEAARVIADVADELARRRSRGPRWGNEHFESGGASALLDDRAVVLIVGDLGRLRRWLPDDLEATTLEQLATIGADGPTHGVNLVCVATRADDLGPLVRLSGDRLVGTLQEAGDRTRLGVPTPGPADRHAGRCWSVDAERRVQLATPPDAIDVVVAELARADDTETDRPPS